MSSGDAYIYCLIISDDAADKISRINLIMDEKQKLVDEIVQQINVDKRQNPERGQHGLAIMDEMKALRKEIRNLCKNPIAIYDVADDSWIEAYRACREWLYTPTNVNRFIEHTKGKLWCKDELIERWHGFACLCLPSHYDCDQEFLEELGITTRRLEDYNNRLHTEPITGTEYALVSLSKGYITMQDKCFASVAYEWARNRYEFGNTDYEVRELEVREIRVVDKKELDELVDKTYGDETQYGISWHVDVDKHESN
jgi:hypothetical protein